MAASSFKKKVTSKTNYPRGTRPSFHNSSLLLSTGVPSLDALLGGGVAVGTVLLVEEDTFSSYSRLLLKYFMAEGVMCGHELYLASLIEDTQELLNDLPSPLEDLTEQKDPPLQTPSVLESQSEKDESMRIAWRYQHKPQVESSFSTRFGHFYDLTQTMDKNRLANIATHHYIVAQDCSSSYMDLFKSATQTIDNGKFLINSQITGQSGQRNVLRMTFQSLGTPLWGDKSSLQGFTPKEDSISLFLHKLRALLRRSYAVAMVTMPTHLIQDEGFKKQLQRFCDGVIGLESFAGSDKEKNPLYREYHGLFHLIKVPAVNSLVPPQPETRDLAFKLKRKKFTIEKLHLPPELSETVSRTQEDPVISRKQLHNLDF